MFQLLNQASHRLVCILETLDLFPSVAKTIVCDPVVGLTSFDRFGHQKVFQNLSHSMSHKQNDLN